MISLPISGHCLCGAVTYQVAAEPMWVCNCHCSDCRRCVGGALATFAGFERRHFTVTSGAFTVYESSPGVRRSFCGRCGTPMAYESDRVPADIHLLVGTLDNPEDFPPTAQVFCREQLPWLKISVDGPSFDGLPES